MSSKFDFDNIVYINRDIDVDRKDYIEKQLDTYQVKAKRFEAVSSNFDDYCHDWRDYYRTTQTTQYYYEDPLLSTGEVGCLLSHLECIRLYGENDLIVLEDDLDFSTIDYWNFKFSEFLPNLGEDVEILQMVKYHAYTPVMVRKLVIGEYRGNWGTAAYYIKSSLAKKIVSEYYIDGKWMISKMPCFWTRKTADAILYSYPGAYTCMLFSLRQEGTSTINNVYNPSAEAGAHILHFFRTNTIDLKTYFYL